MNLFGTLSVLSLFVCINHPKLFMFVWLNLLLEFVRFKFENKNKALKQKNLTENGCLHSDFVNPTAMPWSQIAATLDQNTRTVTFNQFAFFDLSGK